MSKIKNPKSEDNKQLVRLVKAILESEAGEKILVAAMDKMFTEGKWEIPDDAIVGIYAHKVDQLAAQNESLLKLVKQLSAEVRGEPIKAGGRVDAIAASKQSKSKK